MLKNDLPTVDEFLKNSNLKSYDNYHQPAYYDEEFRNKTVELAEKFNLKVFIETGSFDGRNVVLLNAMEVFEDIHTIEYNEEQYTNLVVPNNKDIKNNHCHFGDSVKVMGDILESLSEDDRCFIFIDAHNAPGLTGWDMLPLQKELDVIYKSNIKDPVIAIHDFYCPTNDGGRRFHTVIIHPETKQPITTDDISDQLDKIYGKGGWNVDYSTKSDHPGGGTGLGYFYPKV